MLRIALTGPESTGKSTLCQQLAAHYRAPCVPEYARAYLAGRRPPYALADLEAIARGQLAAEDAVEDAAPAGRVLFCDTDLRVIKIWAEHAFGHCPAWIARRAARPRYGLVLLLGVDVPWEPDPLREHPAPPLRQHFYDRYRAELRAGPDRFAELWGPPAQRLAAARQLIDALLSGPARP